MDNKVSFWFAIDKDDNYYGNAVDHVDIIDNLKEKDKILEMLNFNFQEVIEIDNLDIDTAIFIVNSENFEFNDDNITILKDFCRKL